MRCRHNLWITRA